MVQSESNYLRMLRTIVEQYMRPLLAMALEREAGAVDLLGAANAALRDENLRLQAEVMRLCNEVAMYKGATPSLLGAPGQLHAHLGAGPARRAHRHSHHGHGLFPSFDYFAGGCVQINR